MSLPTESAGRVPAPHDHEQSLKLFRVLVDHAADAIEVIDAATGRFVDVNAQACRLHGYTREEYLALSVPDIDPNIPVWTPAEEILPDMSGTERRVLESVHRRKDGTLFPVEIGVSYIRIDRDYQVAVVRDISARKEAEAAARHAQEALRISETRLRQAEKMEAVGRLAGGVAHDFNNILTAIISYADLLLERQEPDAECRREVGEIRSAARRAAVLTRQLLAFSRQQIVQPRVVDVNQSIRDVQSMLRRLIGEDISLVMKSSPEACCVRIDPSQLEQVLMNLALNARDAMPDGGTMTIRTALADSVASSTAERPASLPGPFVVLSVADTGMGMDDETRARVFEPFFTTKGQGQGTGLGLATVYGIVKQADGYVWVRSAPGQGAIFEVYLPRVSGAPPAEQEQRAGRKVAPGQRVLVVEDDANVRRVTSQILVRHGYEVVTAENPDMALAELSRHHGAFDLLLTDLVLPGMNGRLLAAHVSREWPNIRVVYMSGYAGETILEQGILPADEHFLPKPFTVEELLAKVAEALEE
jgi:two-component system, cell cycle sensor histidine kinase and response regulator CckA